MKRALIASLVGAIIIFIWQAVSHMFLGNVLHSAMNNPAPNQEAILQAMSGQADGMYCIPEHKEGESMEDMTKRLQGKPGAMIFYDASMDMNMGGPMAIGFILDLIGVFIVVAMLGYARERLTTFGKIWWAVMLFGLFLVVMHHLMGWNWMGIPTDYTMQESIDTLIAFCLLGLWLGWYFSRAMAMPRSEGATM